MTSSKCFVRSFSLLVAACGLFVGCGNSAVNDDSSLIDSGPVADASVMGDDASAPTDAGPQNYEEVTGFGTNPGEARMFVYSPRTPSAHPGMIMAIHGCTQNATQYRGAGWEDVAEELGMYVVYPEQRPENEILRCWHFWEPTDTARTGGETESLAQMIDYMVANRGVDAAQVYVSGLSSGAGISVALSAAYPEKIRASAIMAGLPYRCPTSLDQRAACTTSSTDRTPEAWGDLVRAASSHTGPFPRMSVWVGSIDWLVIPANSAELVDQWTNVHGIDRMPEEHTVEGRVTHDVFRNGAGDALVESYLIEGMNHGTAIDPTNGCGHVTPFVFDEHICSTRLAARFFGLID